jgi:hypothetical protein
MDISIFQNQPSALIVQRAGVNSTIKPTLGLMTIFPPKLSVNISLAQQAT